MLMISRPCPISIATLAFALLASGGCSKTPAPRVEKKPVAPSAARQSAAGPKWGHLSGRFVFDGQAPPVRMFPVFKDEEVLGKAVSDESLLVNPTNGGVANVVVYLFPLEKDKPVAVHRSYEATAKDKVTLTTRDGRFDPHVLLVRTGQTIVEENLDEVAHNANIYFVDNEYPRGLPMPFGSMELPIKKEERFPVEVDCNIHPWMRGYLLLRDNPYMAKTDADGRFAIKHLPVGRHRFQLWHERAGFLRNLPVGSYASDKSGRVTITVEEGDNYLGDVRVKAEVFER